MVTDKKLLELFKLGHSNAEVGTIVNMKSNTVSKRRIKLIEKGKLSLKYKLVRTNVLGDNKLKTKEDIISTLKPLAREILSLMNQGLSNIEIAAKVNKNVPNISVYRSTFKKKGLLISSKSLPQYPAGCETPGQKAAYTRSLNNPKVSTISKGTTIKSTKDLNFIVNGVNVTVHHNKCSNVFIGTDKIIVNF